MKDFAQKRQVKHSFTVIEPSIPFDTLVKLVPVEDKTREKIRILDLPLEINNVTSKLESQNLSAETYNPNPEVIFTQTPT